MSFAEAYLQNPGSFPDPRQGEPWGQEEIRLDLAGGPYRIRGLLPEQCRCLRRRFDGYLLEPGGGGVDASVFRADAGEFRRIDVEGWEYHLDLDFRPRGVRVAGRSLAARLDWQGGLAASLWTPLEGEPFTNACENFLRLLVAYRLLETGGVLVHSAAVAAGAGAYLFPGASGAGKSTISKLGLEAGYTVLSDDMNALCPGEEGSRVVHLPFLGDIESRPATRRLEPRALCRLVKGPSNRLQPMSFAEALALTVACAPWVNCDPHRRARLLQNLEALLRTVSAHVLTFSLAGGFQRLLENPRIRR